MLRDPTRGGVATTLKEIALQSQVGITLNEASLPVSGAVRGVCAILGLDPLYVANEGKLLAVVAPMRQSGCWSGCGIIRWGRRRPSSAK